MKIKHLFLTVVTLFLTAALSTTGVAQTFELNDGVIMHNEAPRACIVLKADPEADRLKEAWQDYVKDNFGVKIKGRRGVMSADKVNISRISSNTIDLYTLVEEDANGATMKVFAAKGYDIYINPNDHPVEFEALHRLVVSFAKETLPTHYGKMVDDAEKQIENLLKEQADLERRLADKREKLNELEKEMDETKAELRKNEDAVKAANEQLRSRTEKLEQIKRNLQKL